METKPRMTQDQIDEVVAKHTAWLELERDGERADFRGMDLRGANFSYANLTWANFCDANLWCANFHKADLYGADLHRASLTDVHEVIALGQPNGWWAYAYLRKGTIWVRVGCRTKSIRDARIYWNNKYYRREVLVALDYAEAIASLRGWKLIAA